MKARIRILALAGLGLMLTLAAGCSVRPMLAEQPAGMAGAQLSAALDSVSVEPVSTRYAQEVRNRLIFLLHGGKARPQAPRYTLALDVTRKVGAAAQIQSGGENEPSAGTVDLTARYTLTDSQTGEPVARGEQRVSSAFDRPRQEFAVVRAQRDAEDRAARELASFIHLALGQDLARLDGR